MTRSTWPLAALSVSFGLTIAHASSAEDMTVKMGVKMVGQRCVTFTEQSQDRALRQQETLHLYIKNHCPTPWNIRIDRDPNERFSKDCVSVGTAFPFEVKNRFNPQEERRVDCTVKPKPAHIPGTYVFLMLGTNPNPSSSGEIAVISNLAVEIDP